MNIHILHTRIYTISHKPEPIQARLCLNNSFRLLDLKLTHVLMGKRTQNSNSYTDSVLKIKVFSQEHGGDEAEKTHLALFARDVCILASSLYSLHFPLTDLKAGKQCCMTWFRMLESLAASLYLSNMLAAFTVLSLCSKQVCVLS